jgi:hypothetical protein
LEYERLDLLAPHSQHGRDLTVRVVAKLEENQCGALIEGQPTNLLQQLAQRLPPLDLVGWSVRARPVCDRFLHSDRSGADAKLRQATIARDRVKPWSKCNRLLPTTQRAVRGHKRQLQRVLGFVSASEHMHTEREHASCIAIVNRLEGGIVARTHSGDKLLVGPVHKAPTRQRRAEADQP